jgi:hypothetical protein
MSGRIEGRYSTRAGGARFAHTLFLAPGLACVSGWHPAGDEDGALYRYTADPEELENSRQMFRALLCDSRSLIRIGTADAAEALPPPAHANRGVRSLLPTLSLATMPEEALSSMADRAMLSEAERRAVFGEYEQERAQYRAYLDGGFVQEFFALPSPDALREGRVRADTAAADLRYAPEELLAHGENVCRLLDANANYRVFLLPETAFSHIRISITGTGVTIRRLTPPCAAFTVTHPLMQSAFRAYAEELSRRSAAGREALAERLEAVRRLL